MSIKKKGFLIISLFAIMQLCGTVSASVSQTIKYNFKAVSEPSVAGWEDVVHPSDDASQSEVVVNTGGWSLITVTGGWTPIFGATAFAANGETVSDGGFFIGPFAEYVLQSNFLYGLPTYPDYNAEFILTGNFYPSYQGNGSDAFEAGVLNSNWSTQVVFSPYGPPAANIILTGLNPAKVYTFKIAGSLESSAAGFLVGSTTYAVGTPANNMVVNTKGNTSHYATFAGVTPNATGEISLWANSSWNPGGYIGMLGGIEVIESDAVDIPDILFGSDTLTVLAPASSTSVVAGTSVGGGASIIEHRWKQVKGPIQATIVSPTSANTDINGLTILGVYEFELTAIADNGIESRKSVRVVVDSGNWTKRTITNSNPLANDGQDIQYLEYLPDEYATTGCENKNYPVIIYLHGFGQNGNDTEMLKGEGLGYLVDQGLTNLQFTGASGELEKFIAIIPQLSTGGPWDSDDIDAVVAHILSGSQYRADYNRIYIDGFSYGSLGLWNYLGTPNKADAFAASVNSAFVPTRGPQYCNANGVQIFAMSEADMIGAGYYISSPDNFTGFMENLSLCPMTPSVVGQVMTGRDHVEMYHFYWQTDYTGFEGKNIYSWFLDHERNYASGGAGLGCFSYTPGIDVVISPSVQTVLPSDTAAFTVTVINTGNSDLTGLEITSDTVPNCTISIPFLAYGTSTGYNCDITNVNTGFLNTLTATGYAYSGGVSYMSNSDTHVTSATVNVASFVPALGITQTPPTQNVLSGDNATITITITNTGDSDLSGIVVTNPTIPGCDTTIGYLAQGLSTGYSCTLNNVVSSLTTTTYISGYAYSGGTLLLTYPTSTSVSSDITVTLVPPAYNPLISIIQTPPSQNVLSGDSATITILITNTGDVDLSGLVVSNPTMPLCDTTIGYLAQGASTGYSCSLSNVISSYTATTYTSGYAYSGGSLLLAYPTATSTFSNVTVSLPPPPLPTFNQAIIISLSPSSQSITSGTNATVTVSVINTGDTDLSGVVVTNPSIPSCSTVIGYIPVGGIAGYSCQATGVTSSFITSIYVSGYVFSGSIEYTGYVALDTDTAMITVLPIVVTPPTPVSHGGFGGGSVGVTAAQALSGLPITTSTTTTLSSLPQNNTTIQGTEPLIPITPTVIVQYPEGTLANPPLVSQGSQQSYPTSTNGSDDYKLPYASLRQLLSSLVQ